MVALRSGDGEGSQNDARTVATPTLEVTGPTGTIDEDGLTADERRAANNIAAALEASADFDEIDARCTARKLVQADGVKGLQDKGYLDQDLNFIADTSPVANPQIFTEIITVGVGCVFESVTFPTST